MALKNIKINYQKINGGRRGCFRTIKIKNRRIF